MFLLYSGWIIFQWWLLEFSVTPPWHSWYKWAARVLLTYLELQQASRATPDYHVRIIIHYPEHLDGGTLGKRNKRAKCTLNKEIITKQNYKNVHQKISGHIWMHVFELFKLVWMV